MIYSCFTFDLEKRIIKLLDHGFTQEEISKLTISLKKLTNNIVDNQNGLWKKDFARLNTLKSRQDEVLNSDLNEIEKIYWLMEDCKRYGTLPFAGLARAGFVAIQLLKSLVTEELLSEQDYVEFINSINTVSSDMNMDLSKLDKESFLKQYGHLRPGTYDILIPSYGETPDRYFQWDQTNKKEHASQEFKFSSERFDILEAALKKYNFTQDVENLFCFIKGAIEGREYAKFLFTKNISESMNLLVQLGTKFGFTRDELSYADISIISTLYSSTNKLSSTLRWSIGMGKKVYGQVTQNITLPPPLLTL